MQTNILPKTILLCLACLSGLASVAQQSRYIIQLADKQDNPYSISRPWEFLSPRAVGRRTRFKIAIDSTDLPVTPSYLDSIRQAGAVEILNTSKWLNQVGIRTNDAAAITKINSFPFVIEAKAVAAFTGNTNTSTDKFASFAKAKNESILAPEPTPQNATDYYNYGAASAQINIHQGKFLHNHGFRGQGMQMAVIDAGFFNYLTLPTFDSMRINNQVLGTWDFVTNDANVNEDHYHGMWCLSDIAANLPGSFVGTAPQTSFYLYRTEDVATETQIEEQNYAAALERADSLGVEISSVSLGYFDFDAPNTDYTYADMDGNTTISARAADMAAHKGMLLVIALGNEGGNPWQYLITPADADSVLAVGAVGVNGVAANFSSYGPSFDGRIKPGVAAVGNPAVVAHATTGNPANGFGTSLACPNMAGLATCLWQAFPEANNMDIINTLQESANRFTNPDDRTGYGIPDMKKAFTIFQNKYYTQEIKQAGCNTFISINVKTGDGMNVSIERKLPADADFINIQSFTGSGAFAKSTYQFSDDLSSYTTPISISYRVKMDIPGDTSFYFSAVNINHLNNCNTYSFIGDGSWTNSANWAGGIIPPSTLPQGSTIIVDPIINGVCILNVNQEILAGAYLNVMANKKLTVTGNLNIEQ